MLGVTLGDVCPWNNWKSVPQRDVVEDETTGRFYRKESHCLVRCKCCALVIVSTPAHVYFAFRAHKSDNSRQLLTQLFITTLLILTLEMAALYGILNPYDGRKVYASFERMGPKRLAPCFQPLN